MKKKTEKNITQYYIYVVKKFHKKEKKLKTNVLLENN